MKQVILFVVAVIGIGVFAEDADPAEVAIGERLFLETRFSQFFFANCGGDVNAKLPQGDPVMDETATTSQPLPGPFKGEAMNCRACHLVDEHKNIPQGVRTYADFAVRSPIPLRDDGKTKTLRNSPALVNASLNRKLSFFLHFDAEFPTGADLAKGTLTGRNFGWLATERRQAISHIAKVIRKDDGSGALAQAFGGSYARVLKGESEQLPEELVLPDEFRINVEKATDDQILDAVARLIAAYMRSLEFSRDDNGDFNGSPFDLFLRKNKLPLHPEKRETDLAYARRLRAEIEKLSAPQFVTSEDGKFELHQQPFQFGETELRGLKIFLAEPPQGATASTSGIGNCIACHAPPKFTDFQFHNTGATQDEYDAIHGDGAFAKLEIPSLKSRAVSVDLLPPNAAHPTSKGLFASIPDASDPRKTDLGLWLVFANTDVPGPQFRLKKLLKQQTKLRDMGSVLDSAIARFKTPGLRSLSQSAPYLHTGQKARLEDVMEFYRRFSNLSRDGKVRNADPELQRMMLQEEDIDPLSAFMRSLNEDYQ